MEEQISTTSNSIPKSTPKDVFMQLLLTVTLYASVISFITLLWQYINVWFPDPLNYYHRGVLQSIRWSASVLVVMFPVYVLLSWLINRDFKADAIRRDIKVRKWLVYLTLFISALTVIIDVITLVYNFLGGELTLKFFLKILVVLITAAAVFGYYFWDLRKMSSTKSLKVLGWGVSIVVLAAIVGGFFIVGSPARQRLLNFDQRRVEHLQSIQSQIVYYWQQKGSLPAKLADLQSSISGFTPPADPETGTDYEYVILSNLSFQLCANFKLPTESAASPYASKPIPAGFSDPYSQNWTHDAGRVCFDRIIDPQLDKPMSSPGR